MILLSVPEVAAATAADVVVIGIAAGDGPLPAVSSAVPSEAASAVEGTAALPLAATEAAAAYVAAEPLDARAGEVHVLPMPGAVPSQIWLAGLGAATTDDLRIAGVAIGRKVSELPEERRAAVAIDVPGAAESRALAEGLVLGGYQFHATPADEPLYTVELIGTVDPAGLSAGDLAADAAAWARDLGNTPAADLTPETFGERADDQLTAAGCTVQVHDEQWLVEAGFGGVLAVGGGAAARPRLIEASYRPSRRTGDTSARHIVLVGKGITFDTGGLNLKPVEAMRMMHTDMCGGAAVLAAVQYAAMQKLPVRVTALVPAAENAVSGTAMRPGDVVRHFGGRTSEIGNTDAEGRLVLADALAYAVKRLRPDVLIDIATLTGAMKVALGVETAGYFANDDGLASALEAAAEVSGEAVWRMPLEHGYQSMLESPVADARNDPGNPGAITAALFLQPFVADLPWAHLDIAGPARATEDGPIFSRGATGYGARLLARYLEIAAG